MCSRTTVQGLLFSPPERMVPYEAAQCGLEAWEAPGSHSVGSSAAQLLPTPMTEPYGPQVKRRRLRGSRGTIKDVPVLSNSCLPFLSLNISFLWCWSLRQAPKSFSTAPLRPLSGALAACGQGVTSLRRAPEAPAPGGSRSRTSSNSSGGCGAPAHSPITRGAARRRGGSAPGGLSFAALVAALSCAGRFRLLPLLCLGPTMVLESVVADLLNRLLGDYVENLNKSQLKLGIWGGKREGAAAGC